MTSSTVKRHLLRHEAFDNALSCTFFLIGVAVVATVVGVAVGLKLNNEKESNSGKALGPGLLARQSHLIPLQPQQRRVTIAKASEGVQAEYMTSQFPTKTFPNHYTIATGLYPESHGIVSNSFLSEDRSEYFRIGSKAALNSKWWKGEPSIINCRRMEKQGTRSLRKWSMVTKVIHTKNNLVRTCRDSCSETATFLICIDRAPPTPEFKLLQLRQHLPAAALEAIENDGFSGAACEAAKERLERKFGGRRRGIGIHLEDLGNFKPVKLLKKLPETLLTQYNRWIFENQRRGCVVKLKMLVIQESEFYIVARETIWNTVRRQGLKSASYFWVGSEVNIGGLLPNYWKRYNGNVPFEDRVDQVLKWLEMDPSERPNLLLTYFEEPDKQGHSFGPDSAEVNKAIKRVDDIIGRLVDGIRKRNLSSCVNIVMTSDHGMTNISCSRAIYLDKFISLTGTRVVGLGASSLLYTDNSSVAATIVQQLKGVKNLKAYLRDGGNLPNRLHYTNNKRIGDVVLIPDLGWSILERQIFMFFLNGTCRASYRGTHGYDNSYADMRGIFVANGPAFKRGLIARPFENIEIYNLIAEILNVKPAPNNGTFGSLSYFLRKSTN
eukprot:gene4153-20335_t